jgi:hypothetical protein
MNTKEQQPGRNSASKKDSHIKTFPACTGQAQWVLRGSPQNPLLQSIPEML